MPDRTVLKDKIDTALKIGNERLYTLYPKDNHQKWFSIDRVDPTSGESYLNWNPAYYRGILLGGGAKCVRDTGEYTNG